MIPIIDFDVINYAACYSSGGDFLKAVEKVDYYIDKIQTRCESEYYKGYLTGKDNFRKKVATIAPYKGTRKKDKPPHFQAIRDYLVDFCGAVVVNGKEADDQILEDYDNGFIVVSNDKDFRTAPVWIYNFISDQIEYIDEKTAINNYLVQLLTGDKIDNIPGLPNPLKSHHKNPPNFTENTAKEFLSERDITHNLSEIQLMYEKHYKTDKAFDEIATLLWIMRKDAKTYKECNLLYPQTLERL